MLERNKLKKKSGAKGDSGTVKWRFFTALEFLNVGQQSISVIFSLQIHDN